MVAVEIGLLPWLSPSVSGPPPKKQNITQRRPWVRQPASESALMVANGLPLARSGAALAKAPKITSITRRIVSVYPPTGRGARSEEHTSELQSRGHLVCRL